MSSRRRAWHWLMDRTGLDTLVRPMLAHPVPPNTGWAYVLGSATLIVFVMQVVTGVVLSTAYVASASQAYDSLQYISTRAFLGRVADRMSRKAMTIRILNGRGNMPSFAKILKPQELENILAFLETRKQGRR